MRYTEYRPTAALRPWVECFWSVRDEAPSREHRVLPDGCVDLVFDLDAGEDSVVGTMTRPLIVPPAEASNVFGVRFHPGSAASFLRIPLAEITDARVPLRDVWKHWDGRVDLASLERELLRRLDPDRDRRVDAAIARLVASGGAARIDDVASEVGISRQHLARQFAQRVGISPKALARVLRFRRVVNATSGQPRVDWADAAAEHGYYDQSHLIADFRELAGTTPDAFHFSNP